MPAPRRNNRSTHPLSLMAKKERVVSLRTHQALQRKHEQLFREHAHVIAELLELKKKLELRG